MIPDAFIRRETAISVAANAAISALLCWLVFGGAATAPAWGVPGLIADTVPQGFMVAFMAALVPALLARRAVARGALVGRTAAPARAVVPWALAAAVLSAIVTTVTLSVIFISTQTEALAFLPALALKVAIGALIALVVTPRALRAALAPGKAADAFD